MAKSASRDFTVIRGSTNPRSAGDNPSTGYDPSAETVKIDVADASSVRAPHWNLPRPDVVLLLAALSDIDRCERERNLAEQINVFGATRCQPVRESWGAAGIHLDRRRIRWHEADLL